MTETIELSEKTIERLDTVRRGDESFEELVRRLVSEQQPIEAGAWEGTEKPSTARKAVDRVREDFHSQ